MSATGSRRDRLSRTIRAQKIGLVLTKPSSTINLAASSSQAMQCLLGLALGVRVGGVQERLSAPRNRLASDGATISCCISELACLTQCIHCKKERAQRNPAHECQNPTQHTGQPTRETHEKARRETFEHSKGLIPDEGCANAPQQNVILVMISLNSESLRACALLTRERTKSNFRDSAIFSPYRAPAQDQSPKIKPATPIQRHGMACQISWCRGKRRGRARRRP